MSRLFCVQHKTCKCYYLFASSEENCDKEAERIITSKPSKFFELCSNVASYKIGEVDDFSIDVINEIENKSGESYEDLKEDNFCINTNVDKCIELLEKKLAVKPKRSAFRDAEGEALGQAKPKPKPKASPVSLDVKPIPLELIKENAPAKKGTRKKMVE